MLFVLQDEGDLYMTLVLLHCVVLAVLTHLTLPTPTVLHLLAGSTLTRNYVPFCS